MRLERTERVILVSGKNDIRYSGERGCKLSVQSFGARFALRVITIT